MAIINYNDLVLTYPTLQAFQAEPVNSYHIPYAQAEVEGLLAEVFTVPFSSNNLTARDLVAGFTYVRLAPLSLDDRLKYRDMLLARIERLKAGDEAMLVDSGDPLTSGTNAAFLTTDYPPIFTVDDPLMNVVSSDYINDLRDERGQL